MKEGWRDIHIYIRRPPPVMTRYTKSDVKIRWKTNRSGFYMKKFRLVEFNNFYKNTFKYENVKIQ